jgi:Na+-translocating ferredoxin:NAD+ oxidoreductase RNF subunit RnfB
MKNPKDLDPKAIADTLNHTCAGCDTCLAKYWENRCKQLEKTVEHLARLNDHLTNQVARFGL